MTRKHKVCFNLTGRTSEDKDRIIKRMERVLEEPEGPEGPHSDNIDQDLTENPEGE